MSSASRDDDGDLLLTEPEPFRYRAFDDNRVLRATQGDTPFSVAARAYKDEVDRPSMLYWAICDFQPEPIVDPTLEFEQGQVVVIPSFRTIVEHVTSESRREE